MAASYEAWPYPSHEALAADLQLSASIFVITGTPFAQDLNVEPLAEDLIGEVYDLNSWKALDGAEPLSVAPRFYTEWKEDLRMQLHEKITEALEKRRDFAGAIIRGHHGRNALRLLGKLYILSCPQLS